MKRMICALIVVAMLCLVTFAIAQQAVQDPRLNELRQQWADLNQRKLEIESAMIRLEGMFIERQNTIAAEKIEALEEAEPAEVEEAPVEAAPEPEVAE